MGNSGRTKINSLIAGPGGFRGVESVWEGNKLITFMFLEDKMIKIEKVSDYIFEEKKMNLI